LAAKEAFEEIWQQDQDQSHFSAAALVGLSWVALQREDWSAARRHFATALPLIEQLQTAPQALEALWATIPVFNKAQTRSTQREREHLFGGHMPAFRPFLFKHDIPEPSA
jgi:hypothetical protein